MCNVSPAFKLKPFLGITQITLSFAIIVVQISMQARSHFQHKKRDIHAMSTSLQHFPNWLISSD